MKLISRHSLAHSKTLESCSSCFMDFRFHQNSQFERYKDSGSFLPCLFYFTREIFLFNNVLISVNKCFFGIAEGMFQTKYICTFTNQSRYISLTKYMFIHYTYSKAIFLNLIIFLLNYFLYIAYYV